MQQYTNNMSRLVLVLGVNFHIGAKPISKHWKNMEKRFFCGVFYLSILNRFFYKNDQNIEGFLKQNL